MKDVEVFLKEYENATNSHKFEKVKPFIDKNATYWFSDGVHEGIVDIEKAFVSTWKKVEDECYSITDVNIIVYEKNIAVCTYTFTWRGKINGIIKSGKGRGIEVLQKKSEKWVIMCEHLSTT